MDSDPTSALAGNASLQHSEPDDVIKNQVFYRALGWMQRVLVLTWALLAVLIVIVLYPTLATDSLPMKVLIGTTFTFWGVSSLPVVLISELRESLWLYIAGTSASALVVALSHFLAPDAGIIFFALFPLIWMSTNSLRRGTLASVAVVLAALAGASAVVGFPPDLTTIAALTSSGVVSVIIGFWMNWVFHTTEKHWLVAQQLREAQAHLELLSHDRGVLEERERVAAEIHDTVAQGFLSIVTMARLAQRCRTEDPKETRRLLELIESAAQHNLEEARQLVSAGTPPDLDTNLVEALERLAKRTEAESHLQVEVHTTDTSSAQLPIGSNVAVAVLRCAQEALTNAVRHACSDRVAIELSIDTSYVTLKVEDDGIGFDSNERFGIGLSTMNRRITNLDGQFAVATTDTGSGTLLSVKIPRVTAGASPFTSREHTEQRPKAHSKIVDQK